MTDSSVRPPEPTWDDVARMLTAADDTQRRDTSAGWKASAEKRRCLAAERWAVEEFPAKVPLLSEATLLKLTAALIAQCQVRGIPVPEV